MSFAARWTAGEPVLNDEHDDFRWLAPDALGDLKVTGGLQEIIRRPGACSGPEPAAAGALLPAH